MTKVTQSRPIEVGKYNKTYQEQIIERGNMNIVLLSVFSALFNLLVFRGGGIFLPPRGHLLISGDVSFHVGEGGREEEVLLFCSG